MPYSRKTTFYDIPVMGFGDQMTEEQEMAQMGIIDGMLYAACFGCEQKLLIREGSYSIEFNDSFTSASLVIRPTNESDGYSLFGIINKRLFYSTEELTLDDLEPGETYYIYAKYTDSMETNPGLFELVYLEYEETDNARLLPLCLITVNTGPYDSIIKLDIDKPMASGIVQHTSNTVNPHGAELTQSIMHVVNSMDVSGYSVFGSAYGSYTTAAGETEYAPPNGTSPVFVTAYPESTTAGQIAWRISDGNVYFSNSGSSGVTVNFKVELRQNP